MENEIRAAAVADPDAAVVDSPGIILLARRLAALPMEIHASGGDGVAVIGAAVVVVAVVAGAGERAGLRAKGRCRAGEQKDERDQNGMCDENQFGWWAGFGWVSCGCVVHSRIRAIA